MSISYIEQTTHARNHALRFEMNEARTHAYVVAWFSLPVPQRAPPSSPAGARDRGQQEDLIPEVAVEGAEEVAELRQQHGEVPAGRREGGEGAEQEAHGEQRRRRPHRSSRPFAFGWSAGRDTIDRSLGDRSSS